MKFASAVARSWNDTQLHAAGQLSARADVPVQDIDNVAIPGLTGNNQTTARNLLTDLSGSVAQIQQGFDIRDSEESGIPGLRRRSRS